MRETLPALLALLLACVPTALAQGDDNDTFGRDVEVVIPDDDADVRVDDEPEESAAALGNATLVVLVVLGVLVVALVVILASRPDRP